MTPHNMKENAVSAGQVFPRVDYDAHPAYASSTDRCDDERSEAYASIVRELDELLDPIRSAPSPAASPYSARSVRAPVKRAVERARQLLLVDQCDRGVSAINTALDLAPRRLLEEARYRGHAATSTPFEIAGSTSLPEQVKASLTDVGAYECHLDPAGKSELRTLLKPWIDEVTDGRRSTRIPTSLPREGPAAELLIELLNDAGIPDGFKLYCERDMRWRFWSLLRSEQNEVWWRDAYQDVGVPTSPTAYFHNDYFVEPKVLVYLTDVESSDGPFEYLAGSHLWERSRSAEVVNKELERAHKANWKMEGSTFYRQYVQIPDFRRSLIKLPPLARQVTHFGDDVLAGSEQHHVIEQAKRSVTSDEADCIAFDGCRTTHRGSLTTAQPRLALVIGFMAALSRYEDYVRRGRTVGYKVKTLGRG